MVVRQLIEEYNDMPAQFGPSLPTNGIKVFTMPSVPDEEACVKIGPPDSNSYPPNAKFAAIIRRYLYLFFVKCFHNLMFLTLLIFYETIKKQKTTFRCLQKKIYTKHISKPKKKNDQT